MYFLTGFGKRLAIQNRAAFKSLIGASRGFFSAPERLSASEWCESKIVLPSGANESKPGKVDFSYTPYLREPLDTIDDPNVQEVILVAPTRIGKTFLLRMAFAYSVAGDPGSMLWIDMNADSASDVSNEELIPLVNSNPILRARKPNNRHLFAATRMLFPGAAFKMVGANTVTGVSGKTRQRVLGNEVDKWLLATAKEASIIDQCRARSESFDDLRWHCFSSTPTLETMTIWVEYLLGDQRRYFVPLPCGHFQELAWKQVDWTYDPRTRISKDQYDLDAVRDLTRYRCAECGKLHDQKAVTNAVRDPRAHWRATKKGHPKYWTGHVNGLYGPNKSNEMGALAVDFLSSRDTGFYTDRQKFWNLRMGLPWVENATTLKSSELTRLEANYVRGKLPADVEKADLIIVEADVQTWGIPYVVRGYNWNGESWCIDHATVKGKCVASFDDLEQIQRDYQQLGKRSYVIIDISFADRRQETLEAIYLRQTKGMGWYGVEGYEFLKKDIVRIENRNAFMGGRNQGKEIKVKCLEISTYHFKLELEKRLKGEIGGWHYYSLQSSDEFELRSDFELNEAAREREQLFIQLLDERRVPRKKKAAGKPDWIFESKAKNNHGGDCEVYGIALFYVLKNQRSAAARKKKSSERGVIEVQN
ncbi:MAG: terminase gpA endonuclease subunit [Verrucomicrobiota bacterium]